MRRHPTVTPLLLVVTRLVPHLAARLRRAAAVLRRIIGAPDYASYLAHMQAHHPDARPLTPREFDRQRLSDRYDRPGSRCC